MYDLIYFNFFVVSILIGATFYLIVGFFILLMIPEKSSATRMLGLAYLFSSGLATAYVFGYSVYHPMAAYHRWLSIPSFLVTHPFCAQIFYHFPKPRFPRMARVILTIQMILAVLLTGLFVYTSLSRGKVYSFSGHFWDLDIDDITRIVAVVALLNLLNAVVAGILHIVVNKEKRVATSIMFAGLMLALVVPTVTNILSRDGLLARDIHQTLLVLFSIVGFFVLLIAYLNSTQDKTTFMVKIVGISLVTFMVVMVFVSYFSFQDKEDAYDSIHLERTSRLSIEPDYPVADLSYLVSYDFTTGKLDMIRGKESAEKIDFTDVRAEFITTAVYERIRGLSGSNWKAGLEEILKGTPEEFQGYAGFLRKMAEQASTPQELLALADAQSQQITHRAIKIREIPDNGFRAQLLKYLEKFPIVLFPFASAIKSYLAAHPDADGSHLKHDVLHFFSPLQSENARRYRISPGDVHYTAFNKYDPKRKVMFEAGYNYRAYRQFIQPVGLKLTWMFFGIVVFVIVGFRLFFLGTLVRPLESLLSGVRKVNKGDLGVQLQVGVADEIGFLTESFNGMVSSIRTAREKLERYADELEEKVKERTAELTETLQTVQALKSQQDGDYFLTSLLIKPLARNTARSETVAVEFLMEQKKKFEFRKWKEEIGGDFCSAHTIDLRGKKYTVVINADAMGKSIQGAGGALVLGAVFESIMERTRVLPSQRDQSPERWLKNAFQELHGIFESFDGSMLVSMVLGLIDDETGLLYYVNVEHPWTVLYRGGQASFIEKEHTYRKLGVAGVEGQIRVQTFQLEPDDVLILGSDGRDDIEIGTAATGERIINEDEYLFLRTVEAGHGHLPEIRSHIEEQGPLTDDLSLIRVAYRAKTNEAAPDREAAVAALRERAKEFMLEKRYAEASQVLGDAMQMDPRSLKTIRMLVRLFLDQKDYDRAFQHVEDYIYLRPMDTDMIYLASYLAKKMKRLRDAAEFGERVRLRAPEFVRNLLNLSEVYARLGNKDRSTKLLREVLRRDPENRKALHLKEMIGDGAEL